MCYLKSCKICGCEFESEARNTQYCVNCKIKATKKSESKRKRRVQIATRTDEEKEINSVLQKAYKLSREVAELCLPKKCSCTEKGHICDGELHLHHKDHNPLNIQIDNLCWVCEKAHKSIHSNEEDCDFEKELKSYIFIKEQFDIRERNKTKHI